MTVSTTFGYNATEDRLWMRCDAWPRRLWITRRIALKVLQAVVQAIEGWHDADGTPADIAERAAAEHDAAINRPSSEEKSPALRMGSETADAAPLKDAVLCTRFSMTRHSDRADLTFGATEGEWRLQLSRTGLHRWVHALHMVINSTQWHEGITLASWLTRSYLPPALRALLDAPPPEDGDWLDEDD
jgi:hypothetical protein